MATVPAAMGGRGDGRWFAGAWAGAKHLPVSVLRYLLAAILFASGVKLALG